MSGAATGPEFDPRYDARFQRGWGGGEPDGAAPAEPEPAEAAAPCRADPQAPSPPDPPADPPDPPAERVEEPHVEAPIPLAPEPAAPSVAAPLPPTVDASADADAARIVRIALLMAWAISGAAALVGAGLVWSLIASADPFGVRPGGPEMVLQTLAQFAAPSLLATGLLGIVVLTVVDGLRRANRLVAPASPNGSEP